MTSGTRGTGASLLGRRIAAGLATVGLSAAGGALLVHGPQQDWWIAPLVIMALGLVAIATVVGTVWSGQAVGLLLGTPPLSVYVGIQAYREADPHGSIAVLVITVLALTVSAASWGLTFMIRRRGEGRYEPWAS